MDKNQKVFNMKFADIYTLYKKKITSKSRTTDELNFVIKWLTGFDDEGLKKQIAEEVTLEAFFANAPLINTNANLIAGLICGCKIEAIENPLMKKIRQMDKLVDGLAKGRQLEKILP